jgi:hypothetical protein
VPPDAAIGENGLDQDQKTNDQWQGSQEDKQRAMNLLYRKSNNQPIDNDASDWLDQYMKWTDRGLPPVPATHSLVPVDHQPEFDHSLEPVEYDPFAAEKFANPAVRGIISGMATLPQRAIQNSQYSLDTGTYDPGPVLEAAILPMGTGAIAGVPVRGGEAVLGSGAVRPVAQATDVAPKFYSAVDKAVDDLPINKATGQQWLGTLTNKGVKNEEMDWRGLQDYLAENANRPVTKEEVQKHLAENKVELGEVHKGISPSERALEEPGSYPTNDVTKFGSYQLPGGENYREKLLTLPNAEGKLYHDLEMKVNAGTANFEERQKYYDLADNISNQRPYMSSHWDEPNVLVHRRTNEREVNGVPSLHMEEIQSDWHQQGRSKGYRPEQEKQMADLVKQRDDMQKEASVLSTSDPRYKEIYSELPKIQTKINDIGSGGVGVPDAPFKKNWHELALKDAIREAAEKGFSRISWTPGEAQAARYDLSKSVKELYYQPKNEKLIALDHNGRTVMEEHGVKPEKVSDYVGKDVAKRLLETEYDPKNPFAQHVLTGQDLKVGGEGMRGFYDKMIPDAMNKIGKPHGVKVQKGETPTKGVNKTVDDRYSVTGDHRIFDTEEEAKKAASHPVHYMDIPQSLKDEALKKGFKMFSAAGMALPPALSFMQVDHNPFEGE